MARRQRRNNVLFCYTQRRASACRIQRSRYPCRSQTDCMHVFFLCCHARWTGRSQPDCRSFGHWLYRQSLHPCPQRFNQGYGSWNELRTADWIKARRSLALWHRWRPNRCNGQTERTFHTLSIYGGISGRITARQSRMDDCPFRTDRQTGKGNRNIPGNSPTLLRTESPHGFRQPASYRYVQHSVERQLGNAFHPKLYGTTDCRCRRRVHL